MKCSALFVRLSADQTKANTEVVALTKNLKWMTAILMLLTVVQIVIGALSYTNQASRSLPQAVTSHGK